MMWKREGAETEDILRWAFPRGRNVQTHPQGRYIQRQVHPEHELAPLYVGEVKPGNYHRRNLTENYLGRHAQCLAKLI